MGELMRRAQQIARYNLDSCRGDRRPISVSKALNQRSKVPVLQILSAMARTFNIYVNKVRDESTQYSMGERIADYVIVIAGDDE